MKTLKKLMLLALAVIMVFSMVACGGNENEDNNDATPTPKPTPKVLVCDVDNDQLMNYYVKYTVTENDKTTEFVEVGYSNIILKSEDGGESFRIAALGQACFTLTDADIDASFFSAHLRYDKDQFENQGTENVAGKDCTHYFFKNGLFKYHIYVDETFNTTGMTLKFVDEKTDHTGAIKAKTIEVKEIKFDVINKEAGYNFTDFNDRIVEDAE